MDYNFYIKKYWVKYTEDKELIFKPIIRSYCTEDQDSHEPYPYLKSYLIKDDNDNYTKNPNNDKCINDCDEFLSQLEKPLWKKYINNINEIKSVITEYNETVTYFVKDDGKILINSYDDFLKLHENYCPGLSEYHKIYNNVFFFEYSLLINEDKKEYIFVPTFDEKHRKEIYDSCENSDDGFSAYMVEVEDAPTYIYEQNSEYKYFYKYKDRYVEFKDYQQFELLHKFNVPEDRFLNQILEDISKPEPVTQWMF